MRLLRSARTLDRSVSCVSALSLTTHASANSSRLNPCPLTNSPRSLLRRPIFNNDVLHNLFFQRASQLKNHELSLPFHQLHHSMQTRTSTSRQSTKATLKTTSSARPCSDISSNAPTTLSILPTSCCAPHSMRRSEGTGSVSSASTTASQR